MSSPSKYKWVAPTRVRGPAKPKPSASDSSATMSGKATTPSLSKKRPRQPAMQASPTPTVPTASASTASIPTTPTARIDPINEPCATPTPTSNRARYSSRHEPTAPTVPRRFVPLASSRTPQVDYPAYKEAVELRTAGFFQVDPRTWLAEVHARDRDAHATIREEEWGVDAWTVVQCHADVLGDMSYTCSPCPDFAFHKTCVHVKLLADDERPSFLPFSERGALEKKSGEGED